ncbi:hypothetical protein FB45DRAFT_206574 [Roridomyces roridus]|uniref:Chromo domain-containing protein n=1 Tax=Roridomyces roridus TaxID=1738132 RepID=A0AAD7CG09_9AGAR|nr:hypothetical protein FB45DRAFT_206574 [Roridomyces roridus]
MPRGTSPQYFVEAITAARRVGPPHPYSEEVDFLGTTAWEYQVKWAEFPEEQNTWEPPLNLDETCEELVASFWEHVDIDTFTTALEGFEVSATSEWIGECDFCPVHIPSEHYPQVLSKTASGASTPKPRS